MGLKHITWNPNDKGSLVVLSNNNMTASTTASNSSVRATDGVVEGKWYWENTVNANNGAHIGIMSERLSTSVNNISSVDAMFYISSGVKYNGTSSSYGESYTTNDVIGVGLDLDIGTITFYKNGVSQGVAYTTVKNLGKVFPFMCGGNGNPTTITVNFGNEPFKYSIPDGHKAYADQYTDKTLFQKNGKMYALQSNNKVYETKMTSNSLPAPFKSVASSEPDANFASWKAFNGINTTAMDSWRAATNIRIGWIRLDFGDIAKVNGVMLTSPSDSGVTPAMAKDFVIEGSNSTSLNTFIPIKSFTGQTWGANETKVYRFDSPVEYRYYRINVSKTYRLADGSETSGTLAIGEILYFYDAPYAIREFSAPTVDNFIKYGIDVADDIEKRIGEKQYVLQDTVSENELGLWTTQLDRKPLSIKFT